MNTNIVGHRYEDIIIKAQQLCVGGIDKPCMIGGEMIVKAKVFIGETFTIKSEPTTHRFEIVKNDNKNPVLCINVSGEIYRTHGEIISIKNDILNHPL